MLLQAAIFIILISGLKAEAIADNLNSTEQASGNHTFNRGEFLLSKCLKNADAEAHAAFMNAKRSLYTCMVSKITVNSWEELEQPSNIKLLCSESREHAHTCIKDVLDKMAVCLPREEQYLKTYLLDWYDDTAKYMCSDDAAVLTEYFKLLNDKAHKRTFRGLAYVITFCIMGEFPKDAFDLANEIIVENDFCGYMNKSRNCIEKRLKKETELPELLRKLIDRTAESATSLCSAKKPE